MDVVHNRNTVSDLASTRQIQNAATRVLNSCIKNGAPNSGGMVSGVGTLAIAKFTPPIKLKKPSSRPQDR